MFSTLSLLERVNKIEGWFDQSEADLLMTIIHKCCNELKVPHNIVEVGSYQGKSTVLIGAVIKAFYPKAKVYAIDPHNGVVGASDQKLQQLSSTLDRFQNNIKKEQLDDVVELIRDYSYNVKWKTKIALLFIDGLHDYENVSRDFNHFSKWLRKGSYIVFHDYAQYYPGVMKFVDELLSSGDYLNVGLAKSLIVIQRK